MNKTSSVNNKKIFKNTVALYARMLLSMIVSLYTSRIVLNALGVDDYGIYGLVGGIVVLFLQCCVSVIGCCGKCCSCCVVVFLSIYKFKILVFCFGGWFISAYL